MKKLLFIAFVCFFTACNEATNKSENPHGTEISTPSVSIDTAAPNDSAGAGLGADTTKRKTNTADN